MTVIHAPAPRPWGLSRATDPATQEDPVWVSTRLDPETQRTTFLDKDGAAVDVFDATKQTALTISYSKPHDGAENAPERADDSPNDPGSD
ncbi:putative ATP-grasp-modified RiPP [Nonomuraea sp. NPDC059023]|uniref:putative ATP-grasp-modified RiPP n=1 Tax=unclassified Nonomuraea TaxID=2593643 RepID=UPI0036B8CE95